MGRKEKIDLLGQAEDVVLRHKEEKVGWKRERLFVIKQALESVSIRKIAEDMGRSPQTIQTWIHKYRSGGIDSLLSKKRGRGAKSKFTDEMKEALEKELEKGQHRTAKQVWAWLAENFDMSDFKPTSIYTILGKCGGRLKVPRPCNPKKDPVKELEFKTTLADNIGELCLPNGRPIRLWIYDEMRYGLHPLTRKVWCKRGVRAIAPSRRTYKNAYVYGALQIGGGGSEFYMTNRLDQEWDIHFMEQISQRDPYASHVVIGDGAGFHLRDNNPHLPDNVFTLQLPPYCPELNPVEKLWDIVKDGICNRDWKKMGNLEDALIKNLKPYWEDPKRVFSLFKNSYLSSELNVTVN